MQKAQTVKPSKSAVLLERAIQRLFDENRAKIEKDLKEARATLTKELKKDRRDYKRRERKMHRQRMIARALANLKFLKLRKALAPIKKIINTLLNILGLKKYADAISKTFEKYADTTIMHTSISTKKNTYKIFLSWRWTWLIASHCGWYNLGPVFIAVFSNEDLAIQE